MEFSSDLEFGPTILMESNIVWCISACIGTISMSKTQEPGKRNTRLQSVRDESGGSGAQDMPPPSAPTTTPVNATTATAAATVQTASMTQPIDGQRNGLEESTRLRSAEMQRLGDYVDSVGTDPYRALNIYQVRARRQRYAEAFTQLVALNAAVVGATSNLETRQSLSEQFARFEERYLDAVAMADMRVDELTPAAAPALAINPAPAQVVHVQSDNQVLQHLNMRPTWGKFKGVPLEWIGFKQRFALAVHDNKQVPSNWKFTYLKEALVGEPADLIGSGPIDEEGYVDAWAKLCKKYEQVYPLACAYLNDFYQLKALVAPVQARDLQHLSNVASETRRQLRGLKYPVEQWDLVFVHGLHARLGPYSGKWEEKRDRNDQPTFDEMIEFLDAQAAQVQNHSMVGTLQVTTTNKRSNQPTSSSSSRAKQPANDARCVSCNDTGHKIYDCPEFLPLTFTQRKSVVDYSDLCHNCLKPGHTSQNCWDKRACKLPACAQDNKHNSLLCPNKSSISVAMAVSHVSATRKGGGRSVDSDRRHQRSRGRGSLKRSSSQSS